MIRVLRNNWGSMLVGASSGLAAVMFGVSIGPSIDDIAWRLYDDLRPVATINAVVLPGPVGEIRARLKVVRHRGECAFQQMVAIEEFPTGSAVRVFGARVDGQSVGNIPPGITYLAEWRFWPVGAGRLRAAVEYLCDGRKVAVQVKGLS